MGDHFGSTNSDWADHPAHGHPRVDLCFCEPSLFRRPDAALPLLHVLVGEGFWRFRVGDASCQSPLLRILCIAIGLAPVSARLRLIWLAIALHAFLWYYLNEARPYLLLLAGSALACVATMRLFGDAPSQSAKRPLAFIWRCSSLDRRSWSAGTILGALWVGSRLPGDRLDADAWLHRRFPARRPDHLAGHSCLWRDISRDFLGLPFIVSP